MTTFHLTVVTPDGCAFDGQAERIVCRAIDGDLAILAKHGDYCTALGMGEAHIVDADGQRRRAACMGWLPPHGSGPRRSIRPAPRLPRSARRRFLRRRTSTSGTTSWLRRVSSAHWCVPLSTEIRKKEPLHKLCGGSFCVHDEVKNKISAEHAQSECGGHLNRKDVTSYWPSRSGCGCDGPASPPQRCSRRRWVQ